MVLLGLIVSSAVALAQDAKGWKIGQAVKTTGGLVVGHAANTLNGNEQVSEYLGIRYAEPVVGKRRWLAPEPYKGNGTVKADKFGPACPSSGSSSQENPDEDCLVLNVWTKPQTGDKKKAVMVSIYGGGFNIGSSNFATLNGAPLANQQDVVVVSMNYRLNVFGFSGAPGLPDQNLGLRDIRLSLEWVRDNIENFGGDPKRIVIFGESAGGGAVDFYAFANTEDPIVSGFIAQSGSAFTRGIAEDNNLDVWYQMSSKMGCGGKAAGAKTVECMRGKKWQDIMKNVQGGPRVPGETFGPIFDEKTVFRDYNTRAKEGKFVKKPIFIGSNHNEGGLFQVINQLNKPEVNSMNRLFTCLSAKSAAIRLPFKVPVWRYRFFDESPNNAIVPGVTGAYHAADLPFVYGTPKRKDSNGKNTDTPAEKELTKAMMTAWASFAKDPEKGLEKLGYPKYQLNGSTLIQFGLENKAVSFGKSEAYDGECAVYEASKDSIDGIIALAKKRTGGKEVPFKLSG